MSRKRSRNPRSAEAAVVAQNVAILRNMRGWTQQELAKRTGFNVPKISRIENGKDEVPVGTLAVLATAFGLDQECLLRPPRLNGHNSTEKAL